MIEGKGVIKVKSSHKIFTDTEIASLTGICVEHLHSLARSRHLGFIARAAEVAGKQADQWVFTLSDLLGLAMLPPGRGHSRAQVSRLRPNRADESQGGAKPTTSGI